MKVTLTAALGAALLLGPWRPARRTTSRQRTRRRQSRNTPGSTDVRQTNLDLGGTDGALDSVLVNATQGDDNIAIDGFPTRVDVSGLANLVSIRRAEPTDALAVDTRADTDHVVTNNIAGLLQVAVDGVAV